MSYRVTGAAAVVELDDGKPELNTGAKVYLDEGTLVPPNAKAASVEHLISVGLVSENKIETPVAVDEPGETHRTRTRDRS